MNFFTDIGFKTAENKCRMTHETLVGEQSKQRVINLLYEQAMEEDWGIQDCRNMLKSGEVRYYRYRDCPLANETPQFYEEYGAVYKRGKLVSSHYAASIPSGGKGVWDNKADLMTTYGIDTKTGTMRVTQTVAPWKGIMEIDWSRTQNHRMYGLDKQDEESQLQLLETMLRGTFIA